MSRKSVAPRPGSAGRCPRCKSTRVEAFAQAVTTFYARELVTCGNCKSTWEPIDDALIWDPTDPACSFSEPCGNCAFRPGSEEQKDTERWKELVGKLRDGGAFYCHKGVPLDPHSEDGFAYRKEKPHRMRLCRGYLNALGKWWREKEREA